MRQAQITLFMIVILIVLSLFAFLYYITTLSRTHPIQSQVEVRYEDFLASTNFKSYFQTCLDQITADAVQLSGLQGGYLYKDFPRNELPMTYKGNEIEIAQLQGEESGGDEFLGPIDPALCQLGQEFCNYFGKRAIPFTYLSPIAGD